MPCDRDQRAEHDDTPRKLAASAAGAKALRARLKHTERRRMAKPRYWACRFSSIASFLFDFRNRRFSFLPEMVNMQPLGHHLHFERAVVSNTSVREAEGRP
jgi:hypothetical protein